MTDEFIIHLIKSEKDYYYISHNRNEIIATISSAYYDLEKSKLKFSLINEKSLKLYVTSKKDKSMNPNFTRMKIDYLCNIEDYLLKNKVTQEELNYSNVVAAKIQNGTMISSHKNVKSVKLDDFKFKKVIGRGSFGKVCLVEYLPTHEIYVMKNIKKDVLIEKEQIKNILLEKEILESIDYPLLCNLVFFFQNEERIYFVMPFLSGGELFKHLRKFRTFEEEKVRFYGAQIALALDYLHSKGITYSNLKPENILMDDKGYLKLADFGISKLLKYGEKCLDDAFLGEQEYQEYLAPEIINLEDHNKNADWWSFGALLFEMLCGLPPFYVDISDKFKNGQVKFPKRIQLSDDAKDIVIKLLEKNPKKRLGSQKGIEEIKAHPFFASIDFDLIEQKKIPAPFIPDLPNDNDMEYLYEELIEEEDDMNYIPKKNLEAMEKRQDKYKKLNKYINY